MRGPPSGNETDPASPRITNQRPETPRGMMDSSFTFLRVRGIAIGAHWSWVLVAAFIAWSLGSQIYPRTHPGLDDRSYIAMGIVTALIFFGSILLHELGHAFQALKEGMKVHGITLWLFGGVARFEGMFPSAGCGNDSAPSAIAGLDRGVGFQYGRLRHRFRCRRVASEYSPGGAGG
ncbi:MAG: hypothetical protein ACT4OM_03995 [Actinomycetota bacterium]